MNNKRAMMIAVAAILLIGSFFVAGCGSLGGAQKSTLPSLAMGACAGESAGVAEAAPYTKSSGLHPVVYAIKQNTEWKFPSYYRIPAEWQAKELAKVELVACLVEEQTVVEQCPYTLEGGKKATVSRVQVKTVVTLREAKTGKVVATSQAMTGDIPVKCQKTEQFQGGSTTKTSVGLRPTKDIDTWLKQYVGIP